MYRNTHHTLSRCNLLVAQYGIANLDSGLRRHTQMLAQRHHQLRGDGSVCELTRPR